MTEQELQNLLANPEKFKAHIGTNIFLLFSYIERFQGCKNCILSLLLSDPSYFYSLFTNIKTNFCNFVKCFSEDKEKIISFLLANDEIFFKFVRGSEEVCRLAGLFPESKDTIINKFLKNEGRFINLLRFPPNIEEILKSYPDYSRSIIDTILSNQTIFNELATSFFICGLTKLFPEYKNNIITKFINSFGQIKNVFSNPWDIKSLLCLYPEYKETLFKLIISNEVLFVKLTAHPWDRAYLLEIFDDHKDEVEFMNVIYRERYRVGLILLTFSDIKKYVSIFPQYRETLILLLLMDNSLFFKLVEKTTSICELAHIFPEYKDRIITKFLTLPQKSEAIFMTPADVERVLSDYPAYKEQIYSLILTNQTILNHLTSDENSLILLIAMFPEHEAELKSHYEPIKTLEIISIIGDGGFSIVYKATANSTLLVAAKLSRHYTEPHLANFKKEIALAKTLDHENIIKTYGYYIDAPRQKHYLVMELMLTGDLWHLINRKTSVSWTVWLKIAADIASGIYYLHQKGIVHRDLKSPNILLGPDYRAKITDFGYAQAETECHGDQSRLVAGTIDWMAPEVATSARYSTASDMYAFGVILAEITSRTAPFSSDSSSPMEIFAKIKHGACPDIHDKNPLNDPTITPEKLLGLVRSCLFKLPDTRPNASTALENIKLVLTESATPTTQP